MFSLIIQTEDGFRSLIELSRGGLIATTVIMLSVIIALYVLRSIGIYVLAKRNGLKCKILAFVPYAWLYVVCKIVANVKTFGTTFGKIAWAFTLIFAITKLTSLVMTILSYAPFIYNALFNGTHVAYVFGDAEVLSIGELTRYNSSFFVDGSFIDLYSFNTIEALNKTFEIVNYILPIFEIVVIVISVNVYIALFRKYWPQHHILASILSLFGIFAPFVFAVRNKPEVNYAEYVRAKMAMYNARFGNPYGQSGPYSAPPRPKEPEHPFKEYASRGEVEPDDPFSEFSPSNINPFDDFDKGTKDKDKDKKD